jgi:peptidoglycan/xylan/chitin deacetylase (PgdA/CDA1 family)
MTKHHRHYSHHKKEAPPVKLQLISVFLLLIIALATYASAKGDLFTKTTYVYPPSVRNLNEDIRPSNTYPLPTQSPTPHTSSTSATSIVIHKPIRNISHTNFEEISHGDTTKKQVIFTFDAGSGHKSAEGILAALAKHHVKGTFFFTGKWVEANPDLARRIVNGNNEVFNHSYSHPYFTELTPTQINIELEKMDNLLASTTGARTKPYFRPPYGDRDQMVLDAAREAGYQSVYWSVDSLDWRTGETPESVRDRVLPNIHSGAIVLMHVGDTPTGDVLDEILTTIEERGYKIVSLTEGL